MSKLIKLLWCKVVGHKPSEKEYSKECDGSMESYNICDRCGRESNRVTFYDCTDFTPDDLININSGREWDWMDKKTKKINKEDAEKAMDKIMLHKKLSKMLHKKLSKELKTQSDEIIRLKAEAKEKDEMIDALIDELEGTTKTDHTFRLIEKARELIFLKYRR